jgi:hypothetical protein
MEDWIDGGNLRGFSLPLSFPEDLVGAEANEQTHYMSSSSMGHKETTELTD